MLYLIFGNREVQNLFGPDLKRNFQMSIATAAQSANASEMHGESVNFSFRMFGTDGVQQRRASGVKA